MTNASNSPDAPTQRIDPSGPGFGFNNGNGAGPGAPTRPPAKGFALATLIVGIIAFLTGLIPFLGLLLAIAAIALGIVSLVKKQPKALAITGTVLGAIALVAGLISTIAVTAIVVTGDPTSISDEAPTPTADPEPTESETTAPDPAPEPTETAEAAPSADGTAANPLPQPYVAEGLFGGDNYSLTGRIVDANANAAVVGYNQFNSEAPAGFKYVVVELTMTGINEDGVEPSIAAYDLTLATAEGNTYDSEFIVFGEGMPSMSDGPTLYPGSTFTGYTAYIVPEAAESFLIQDNGKYVSF